MPHTQRRRRIRNHAAEGRAAVDIARTMRAFRSGERAGTVMPQLARGYTDADIDTIAAWFAAQRP